MIERYPGHDPYAAAQQLGWQGFERFDSPDRGRILPAGARRLAAPPPPDERPKALRVIRPEAPVAVEEVEIPAALGIQDFPKRKRVYQRAVKKPRDMCKHEDGWVGNGKGTSPGTIRLQCRACGLNRQDRKAKAVAANA